MIVVKFGGSLVEEVDTIVQGLTKIEKEMVIVHGHSYETSRLAKEQGVEERFLTSVSGHKSRYTDKETLEIILKAAENLNEKVVSCFEEHERPAQGLNGADVLKANRKDAIRIREGGKIKLIRDDFTGKVVSADSERIGQVLKEGKIPVISAVALSEDGPVNTDGDRVAAVVANSLGAESLLILTNVDGVLEDGKVVGSIQRGEIEGYIEGMEATRSGGMRKKLLAAGEANVPVAIGNGSNPSSVLEGGGTWIR